MGYNRLCRIKALLGNMLFFLWCYLPISLIQKRLFSPALSHRYYCSVCPLVSGLLTEFTQPGRYDGRARYWTGTDDMQRTTSSSCWWHIVTGRTILLVGRLKNRQRHFADLALLMRQNLQIRSSLIFTSNLNQS